MPAWKILLPISNTMTIPPDSAAFASSDISSTAALTTDTRDVSETAMLREQGRCSMTWHWKQLATNDECGPPCAEAP